MAKIVIGSHEDFAKYNGQEIGLSDSLVITQEQINQFAEATLDPQWIHTDPERAAKESPFGTTIAHGYLTLSLLKHFWDSLIEVNNVKAVINYGIDKFKFSEPVLVGSTVRIRVSMHDLADLRGVTKLQIKVKMEIEGKRKPAFEGIITFVYHFE